VGYSVVVGAKKVMSDFQLRRLGEVMQPEPGNPMEANGVLNPAAARGPDGQLYLFPRLVARGNYSRIGIARVQFDRSGDPAGVERLGVALEPETDYERRPDGGGGCEDPRVTFVEPLKRYVMSYTALSPDGPRIALAMSEDLFTWRRAGLVTFENYRGLEFENVDNKDGSVFPVAIPDANGVPGMAMLHRPLFPGTRPEETAAHPESRKVDTQRESIWISYCPVAIRVNEVSDGFYFAAHHRLASPIAQWERLKIGVGTPPVMTRHGWMIIYHGVGDCREVTDKGHKLCYSAGVMMLSKEHPRHVVYRSREPLLTPDLPEERVGVVSNVVFPTAIDRRDDLGETEQYDVYYGMADDRIGVARLEVPKQLPNGTSAAHADDEV